MKSLRNKIVYYCKFSNNHFKSCRRLNQKLSRIAWSIYRSVRQNYDL